jgi:hypothetical protein
MSIYSKDHDFEKAIKYSQINKIRALPGSVFSKVRHDGHRQITDPVKSSIMPY